MAFFISGAVLKNQLVVGTRDGMNKANKPYATLTVCDKEGNTNSFSTSTEDGMAAVHALQQGDYVDLRIVVAGGPNRQYAMISRDAGSVMPAGSLEY